MMLLAGDDLVNFGVGVAAAVVHEMQHTGVLPPSLTAPSVQLWIPLEGSSWAAFVSGTLESIAVPKAAFDAQLAKLVSSAPITIKKLRHDTAKELFAKQKCTATVRRLNELSHSSYACWSWGSYTGLILPQQRPVSDAWYTVAGLVAPHEDEDMPPAVSAPFTLQDLVGLLRFECPPQGGVLIFPKEATFVPEEHLQVLKIAVDGLCQAQGNFAPPATDAEFIAQSEMRFSSRMYDFAAKFVGRHAQLVEKGGSQRGQILLVTGPSASGKTTFANRLGLALRSFGFAPLPVSMDEYYRDSKLDPNYPRNPDGTPNHELVECLDLGALKQDILNLLAFQAVELPKFDMKNSKPMPKTGKNLVSLPHGSKPVIILEGIFALSPTWVKMLEGEVVSKLFVMPIATSGITELVTVTNQEVRLVRRISRDYLHRGRDAKASIARVPGVQKGENEGIFPLMRHADYVFNTFIDFEVGLLRVYVAPLLRQIEPTHKTYEEGQWLQCMLDGVQSVSDRTISRDSLVREFIGGSLFEMEPLSTHFDNRAGQLLGKRFSFTKASPGGLAFHGRAGMLASSTKVPTISDALIQKLAEDFEKKSASGSDDDNEKPTSPLLCEDEVLAVLNNRSVVGLNLPLEGSEYFVGADIRPLKLNSVEGLEAYNETALLMLHTAVKQVLGHYHRLVVWHRFVEEGDRFCVRVLDKDDAVVGLTKKDRDEVIAALKQLHDDDEPVRLHYVSPAGAVETFLRHHMTSTVRLLESSTRTKVLVATIAGIPALALRVTLPSTRYVSCDNIAFEPSEPFEETSDSRSEWIFSVSKSHVPPSPELDSPCFAAQRKSIDTFATSEVCRSRAEIYAAHRLFSIGEVNDAIFSGKAAEVVSVDEALEFRFLYEVFQRIKEKKARVVFIAGSSSSGKTVISHELQQLLRAQGYHVSAIATDDYYRNLEESDYPTFPNGQKNTESVDALKLELLARHFRQIIFDGVDVTDGPHFDCGKGQLVHNATVIRALPPATANQPSVLVVEGLFALCPTVHALLRSSEPPAVLRVLVHPMPVLNFDEIHLVSATRLRLLRRIARDYYNRGRTAKETLERRHFVQDGEVLNTLPFVDQADVIFNAACVYELAALRSTTEMLLNYVPDSLTDGGDAVRCATQLKELLSWVCAMPETRLPARRFVQLLVDPSEEGQ